ncbi:hypothetical protein DAH66_03810 [Sphingomonas koreensis]|uniref:Uncharacterized protein n=1 Tax=Sphingomonas koreensis TaxID=93064 RepID=A0A430G6K1_9SPHN|nr:hypothetical protein DAH66_03810 [Sphingomonas koreensis]
MLLAAIAAGAATGLTLGLVGGGGSILAVPLLVHVVRLESAHVAIGTAAVAVAANALAGLAGHDGDLLCAVGPGRVGHRGAAAAGRGGRRRAGHPAGQAHGSAQGAAQADLRRLGDRGRPVSGRQRQVKTLSGDAGEGKKLSACRAARSRARSGRCRAGAGGRSSGRDR